LEDPDGLRKMVQEPKKSTPEQSFSVSWHGENIVLTAGETINSLTALDIETAAKVILAPLKKAPFGNMIVDLEQVNFFSSEFITFLMRCFELTKANNGELVLTGVSDRIRELLAETNLDTLWAIYKTRQEALDALS